MKTLPSKARIGEDFYLLYSVERAGHVRMQDEFQYFFNTQQKMLDLYDRKLSERSFLEQFFFCETVYHLDIIHTLLVFLRSCSSNFIHRCFPRSGKHCLYYQKVHTAFATKKIAKKNLTDGSRSKHVWCDSYDAQV